MVQIGAHMLQDNKCEFVLWGPFLNKVELKLLSPQEKAVKMNKDEKGYWRTQIKIEDENTRYFYRLENDIERPDPASHFQPDGVHGPSQVVNHQSFPWQEKQWQGIPLDQMIIYELHIGTFTPEGTFESAISKLSTLKELGINAIEIMPVAQFPGDRNWGYDGVDLFAVQNSYGGPDGLKKLVNACHEIGLAVVLDVVYNHLGPEGNYLRDFGPYFTNKYNTPWGEAVNFDDEYSDEVRNFFIQNAIHWFKNFHIDALRLDAVHAIYDLSAKPFLQELAEEAETYSREQNRNFYLIAETNQNDTRLIRPRDLGGFGLDAQWSDDFHHAVHSLLTGEDAGYYIDFGRFNHLVKTVREGYAYSGEYSEFRKRRHGNSSVDRPAEQFVICIQNHDQVGNRMHGDRLSRLVSFETLKLAASCLLLSPYVPMLFMGEEYGEEAPFLYFVSHGDPDLIDAVRKGRKEEFASFEWTEEPPDPQNEDTFQKSKLNWDIRNSKHHGTLLEYYKKLIQMRKENPVLNYLKKDNMEVLGKEEEKILVLHRWYKKSQVYIYMNFEQQEKDYTLNLPSGSWTKVLDSAEEVWEGPGSSIPLDLDGTQDVVFKPFQVVVFLKEEK